ncbi:MAG: phage major capsid protein [Planctomycetota bacterium]|nr:phage major capsid protein [Planctomycetota bacterium]
MEDEKIIEMLGDIKASVKEVPDQIEVISKRLDALEETKPTNYQAPDDRSENEIRKDGKFSGGAFIRGLAMVNKRGGNFEHACCAYLEKGSKDYKDALFTADVVKAMSTTTGAGGYFAPEEWLTSFVDTLKAKSVCLAAGIDTMPGLTSADVRLPRLSTDITAYMVAENAAITASDLADQQISLSPHEVGCLAKISNRLLKLSNPAIEGVVRNNMAQIMALKVDAMILSGSGSSNEPSGIITTATRSVSAGSAAMTWALYEEFLYDLALDNVPMVKPVWFTHPRTFSKARQLTSSNTPLFVGTPQAQPLTNQLAGNALLGYPVHLTTQLTIAGGTGTNEATLLCGDASEVVLADWGPPEFFASGEADTAFAANQTWIRSTYSIDVAMKHAAGFVKCTDTTD